MRADYHLCGKDGGQRKAQGTERLNLGLGGRLGAKGRDYRVNFGELAGHGRLILSGQFGNLTLSEALHPKVDKLAHGRREFGRDARDGEHGAIGAWDGDR